MTDAEIMKALECCAGDDGCDVCPMYKPSSECITELQGKALDLINRLQSEKEALIAGQETLQKALAEKNAEIERLTAEKENLRCVIEDLSNNTEQAKAEAIKEFAEKVKALFADGDEVIDEIDNLAKEMVGDTE